MKTLGDGAEHALELSHLRVQDLGYISTHLHQLLMVSFSQGPLIPWQVQSVHRQCATGGRKCALAEMQVLKVESEGP